MKTMNSKSSFVRHSFTNNRRMHTTRKVSSPSDEESDSEEDERERRKYLSLQGGESFFWSANRLNKMISTSSKADCYDEINCNYFNNRTSSMSSFKRNVQARHSLKPFRRRPLANIDNLDLTEKIETISKPSHHTFIRPLPLPYDDIEMNCNLEYGFNPLRINNTHSNVQVRLRPLSICTPPREKSNKINHQSGSYFTLAKFSPKIISYATNDYEIELEKQLLHLRSQSCNLDFKGCEGNLTEKELKEDLAMARRQRFVRRKLSFEYHPKKKWKKAVSLDSGLATEGLNPTILKPQLDASKSEELLNDSSDDKNLKIKNRKKKTKSVEFLDVGNELSKDEIVFKNELEASAESTKPQPIKDAKDDTEETFVSASAILDKNSFEHILTPPSEEVTCNNDSSEKKSTPVSDASLCTPVSSPTLDVDSSNEKLEMPTKNSEKRRLKNSIPQIFSNFRLPNKSTFRKLIRRKTLENSTPLKASHDIIRTELFSDKCNSDEFLDNVILLKSSPISSQDIFHQIPKTDTPSIDIQETNTVDNEYQGNESSQAPIIQDTKEVENHQSEIPDSIIKKESPVLIVPCILDDLESVSMDSLTSYGKSVEKHTHKLIDKSISAYSLPRVDEDKEFISSLERRSRSSCSISLTKVYPRVHNESSRGRRMSDTDLAWDERPIRGDETGNFTNSNLARLESMSSLRRIENMTFLALRRENINLSGCSPGKRFMRRILSPVVCGFPPPDKYGMLNDSMHSLNSYDSGSVASDSDRYPQLFDFSSQEIVEEMTLIDKELLVHIPWEELAVLGWMSPDKSLLAPNIMKMVQFFNRIAMLVTTNVLMEESVYRRAKVIKKAIKLAYKCRCLKNYNSLKAVLGGLQCTPVFRLKATWKEVPSRYRRIFRDLSELMTEENNFTNYRKELNMALMDPPCIPFLGNFLTEVAHTHAFQAVHTKYHPPARKNNRKNEVPKNSSVVNIPRVDIQSENPNHDTLERLIFKKNHSRSNSEHSNSGLLHDPPRINGKNHSRTDSDDSGVVLNTKRYSNCSDELESPRESCLCSPDEDPDNTEEIILPDEQIKSCSDEQFSSNNSYEVKVRHRVNISDRLNECECMFWKYQIHCVAYNFTKRPWVCRYLVNSPFNTEEDSYKLSLKREPPKT